ncbi:MAG: hypothetical protein JXA11_04100 [Phycisphaerae bacterium]|nr:hypothetical protein [Phycisphaerae bacterium]
MKRAHRLVTPVILITAGLLFTTTWAKTSGDAAKTDAVKKKTDKQKTETKKNTKKDEQKKDDEALFPKKEGEKAEADEEIHPDLSEFYAEIAQVVKLNADGQKKLLILQEQKAKTLEKYDEKYDKVIVKIENAMDRTEKEKQRETLRAKLKSIEMKREQIEQKYDTQALRALTPDQVVTWNTHELWMTISPELEFDDCEMTEEQVNKSKILCGVIAKKMGAKSRIARNPKVQKMAIGQIGRQILTKEQRVAYARQERRKRLMEEPEKRKKSYRRAGR